MAGPAGSSYKAVEGLARAAGAGLQECHTNLMISHTQLVAHTEHMHVVRKQALLISPQLTPFGSTAVLILMHGHHGKELMPLNDQLPAMHK
jgi:hypothetical protein